MESSSGKVAGTEGLEIGRADCEGILGWGGKLGWE